MRTLEGEFNKIRTNWMVLILILCQVIFDVYIFIDAKTQNIIADGYLISTSLLSYTIIGSFIPILVGALIIHNDYSWNTLLYQTVIKTRTQIYLIKIISLMIFPFLILICNYLFMLLLVIFNKYKINTMFTKNILSQILLVWFILCFWGIFSFVFTLISNNYLFGIVITVLCSFAEMRLWDKVNNTYLDYFPLYNQKSLLYNSFSNLKTGSLIIVPFNNYHTNFFNVIFLVIFFLFVIIIGYLYFINKEDVTNN